MEINETAYFYILLLITFISGKSYAQVHTTYYDAGETIIKEKFETTEGVPNGSYMLYDPQGHLIQVGQYENGNLSGIFYDLHPISQDTLKTTPYKNNQPHGNAKSYYPNGMVSQMASYQEGRIEGEIISYFPSGKLKSKTF